MTRFDELERDSSRLRSTEPNITRRIKLERILTNIKDMLSVCD